MVKQWNSDGGTVWWNSGRVVVEQCGGTVNHHCSTVSPHCYGNLITNIIPGTVIVRNE